MVAEWAERNIKHIPAILFAGIMVIFVSFLFVAKAVKEPPPREADRISDIGTLLVVMQSGCGACTYFEDSVAPDYSRTAQAAIAPVRYIDIADVQQHSGFRLRGGVFATPTLLMIDGFGREVGRSVGSPSSSEDLASLVDRYAARMTRKGI